MIQTDITIVGHVYPIIMRQVCLKKRGSVDKEINEKKILDYQFGRDDFNADMALP